MPSLRSITAEWNRIHARVFRAPRARFTVRYETDVTEEVLFLAFGARRVWPLRADLVLDVAVCVETFLLPVSRPRASETRDPSESSPSPRKRVSEAPKSGVRASLAKPFRRSVKRPKRAA